MGTLERFAFTWLAVPLAIYFLWAVFRRLKRRRDAGDAIFSLATTGAAGMAIEILVIYTFQAVSGTLYLAIAKLVALFMGGLTAGAYLSRRSRILGNAFIADILVLLILLVSAPTLALAGEYHQIPSAWSLVAGFVTGAAFPALLGEAAKFKNNDERLVAASMEAADHLGAAYGALATGLIWLPVYGISTTCLLFGLLKAASLLGYLKNRV
jgi:predicted membrane-bound spermidine synthase